MAETPDLEVVQVGTGENRFYTRMEPELYDRLQVMREINSRVAQACLEPVEVDKPVDHWSSNSLTTNREENSMLNTDKGAGHDGEAIADKVYDNVQDRLGK